MYGGGIIETRDKRITSFICENYCQFCDNKNCNASEIMEKYQDNDLTPSQMEEVKEYQLDNISCKNHIPDEGFLVFGHIIEIHYVDGKVEKKNGWYSAKEISEIWDDDVEYVDILFTDV